MTPFEAIALVVAVGAILCIVIALIIIALPPNGGPEK